MSSITESLFGGSKSDSEQRVSIIPRLPAVTPNITTAGGSFINTALSTVPGGGGAVGSIRSPGTDPLIFNTGALSGIDVSLGLSPRIGEIRDETLGGIRSLLGDVQGDISTLRGLENPFIQARVQPFIADRERARRDAIRRRVAGPLTSLATNPFTDRIGDAGAQAAFESQQVILQNQELIRNLLSDVSGQGRQLLEEELALLGLGQQQIRDIIASQLERPTTAGTTSETRQSPGFLGGAGSFFNDVFGALFPGGVR